MKWMLLTLFALPHLAIGQKGQTENRDKVQTAWCEFSGLVALIPIGDSVNPKTKVLLGTTKINYKEVQWFDSVIIDGTAHFYKLPTYQAEVTRGDQDLLLATNDSLFLIGLDHPFSAIVPDIEVLRYPINNVTLGSTAPEDFAYTISSTDSGSLLTRFFKEFLIPDRQTHIPDSILFLVGQPNWSPYHFETIHHSSNYYIAYFWDLDLTIRDTIYIPDSIGVLLQFNRFLKYGSSFRALLQEDSIYSLVIPKWKNQVIDTIIESIHKPGIEAQVGSDYYHYIDTVYNNTTYLKTIPDRGGTSETYLLPGHARLIQMILTYNGFEEYSFLWVDSTTNNIYAYFDEYGALDTLGKMRDSAVAIGAIHFCWGGVEVGDPDITPTIYPNPAKDVVYYRPAALRHAQQYHIEIFNGQGQLLNTSVKPVDETIELSLKGIPSGLLLIRITGGELSETFKVLHQ